MFVVVVDDLFSVIHAAVADFDCLMITDFSNFAVFWEVLVYYGKESVSDSGAYIFAEWGVLSAYVVLLTVFRLSVVGVSSCRVGWYPHLLSAF